MVTGKEVHSFPRFLDNFLRRLQIITATSSYGYHTADKLKVVLGPALYSISEICLHRGRQAGNGSQNTLGKNLQRLADSICRTTVIRIDNIKYFMPDYYSLSTLSPRSEAYIWKYLKPRTGDVFLDIGAHLGRYSFQVSKIVGPSGLVIAVEPCLDNFQALLTGIRANGLRNILALNIAAWDHDCRLRLFRGYASTDHSAKQDRGIGSVDVQARAMNRVITEVGIKRLEWIKIDVEGAEIEVLRGLADTIRKYAPKVILETFDSNRTAMLKFMEDLGYAALPLAEYNYYCQKKNSGENQTTTTCD